MHGLRFDAPGMYTFYLKVDTVQLAVYRFFVNQTAQVTLPGGMRQHPAA